MMDRDSSWVLAKDLRLLVCSLARPVRCSRRGAALAMWLTVEGCRGWKFPAVPRWRLTELMLRLMAWSP